MGMAENDGSHIAGVVASTTCKRHKAEQGMPCWNVFISASNTIGSAICNARAKRAGHTGVIQTASLSIKRPEGNGRPIHQKPARKKY